MTYRYKVIRESNSDYLQADLDNAWANGWKLVSMVWDYNNSRFVCAFVKEAA